MSLFGGIMDALFGVGGDAKVPPVEWDELAKLMKLGIDENRYSNYGLFSSNVWDEGKDNLTTTINPAIQEGFDDFLAAINQGQPGFEGAGRFTDILNAMGPMQENYRRPTPERRQFNPADYGLGSPISVQRDRYRRSPDPIAWDEEYRKRFFDEEGWV